MENEEDLGIPMVDKNHTVSKIEDPGSDSAYRIKYKLEDVPPVHVTVIIGLQV